MTLVLCFPISIGAFLRIVLKKPNARLLALFATVLLLCLYLREKCANGAVISATTNGFEIVAMFFGFFIVCYLPAILGIKLIDLIRQHNEVIDRNKSARQRLSNVAVILLSLSFIYVINILLSLPWLHLLNNLPQSALAFRFLWMMPEIILFALVGFVILPLFQTTKKIYWVLTLALAGSFVQWVFNRYNFPESYTVLRRIGTIVPPLLPPWFIFLGYLEKQSRHRIFTKRSP
jgi:hypothetical protein